MKMFKKSDELTHLLSDMESGNIIDYEQPLTSMAELEKRIENILVPDEEFIRAFSEKDIELLFNPENIKKVLLDGFVSHQNEIQIRNSDNQEFKQLLELFKNIDSISSGKAVKLIKSVGILSSNDEILCGHSFVRELEGLTGERLIRKVITITPNLIEGIYKRYLSFLVLAKYALSNSNKQPSPKLGVMIQQASSLEIHYPLLIDNDITWLRNSVAHNNWKYDVESDVVIMWDDNHPDVSFSSEEIMTKIIGSYHMSSKIFFDACGYYASLYLTEEIENHDKLQKPI